MIGCFPIATREQAKPALGMALFYSLILVLLSPLSSLSQQAPSAAADEHLRPLLVQGSQALAQGQNSLAEESFRKALSEVTQSIEIMNNLAIALARQHKDEQAIAVYRQALLVKPGDPITERNLGVAYFRAQRYVEALPLLRRFADSQPTFQALDLAGLTLFALDHYPEAAAYLERASQLKPADLELLNMLGKAYYKAKNYAQVSDVFRRIMAIDPNSPEAHVMLGMAYDQTSRDEDARAEYETAEKINPNFPGVHSGRGLIYWNKGKMDAADAEFRQELANFPHDPISNCFLGKILRTQNEPAEAVPYLRAAIASNPNYKEALFELGKCEVMLNLPREALDPLRKAITVDPKYYQAHFVLGTALHKLGRTAEAAHEQRVAAQIHADELADDIKHVSSPPD